MCLCGTNIFILFLQYLPRLEVVRMHFVCPILSLCVIVRIFHTLTRLSVVRRVSFWQGSWQKFGASPFSVETRTLCTVLSFVFHFFSVWCWIASPFTSISFVLLFYSGWLFLACFHDIFWLIVSCLFSWYFLCGSFISLVAIHHFPSQWQHKSTSFDKINRLGESHHGKKK